MTQSSGYDNHRGESETARQKDRQTDIERGKDR